MKTADTEKDLRRFPIGHDLTVQFKYGSMWLRQEQRYGEIEITKRNLYQMIYLAENHGLMKPGEVTT